MKDNTLAKRTKERRIELGFKSGRELARVSCIPYSTIQEIESGKRLQSKYLGNLAQTLKTTTDYLLTGAIALPSFVASGNTENLQGLAPTTLSPNAVPMVPVIEWKDIKTWNGMSISSKTRKYEMVPLLGNSSSNSYALRVKDDSMISLYPNSDSFRLDDILIIDPVKIAKPGSFVLAEIGENPECAFRQLVEIAGEQFLMPLNPIYPKEKMSDLIKILGVLSGSYRQH